MNIIYWCEFPDQVDWKEIDSWLGKKKITAYITCTSRTDFEKQKKAILKITKKIEVNAWPTLPKEQGYWFSGFSSKKAIDSLEQYRGLKIKIDIEPPIPKKYTFLHACNWLGLNTLRKARRRNNFRRITS